MAILLITPIFTEAQEANFPLITSAEVKKSLEENGPAWRARIDAMGHPRLFYDKAGLEAVKTRLMSGTKSPEVISLLQHAYALAPKLPRSYTSPEDKVKASGETVFSANGELWIREAGNEITMMAVAAALDPSPELKKALHDGVIEACHYPTWGRFPGVNNDLASAHISRGIALAWDWFPDLWSSEDRALIIKTITERVGQLLDGLYGGGNAFWATTYPDNHNQVNCTALGWCGLAFYTDIPQAPEWLAAARLDFKNVTRYYPEDGSSAEGVPYWSYGMSYILQYIEGTRTVTDSADLYKAPFLKNAASFRLNASVSGLGGTLPWGDAPLKDYYGPHHILSRLAVEYNDPSPAWLWHKLPWGPQGGMDGFAWLALWKSDEGSMTALPLDYHDWVTDLAMTRSGWGEGDYLLAIKSGFNNRNHSHLGAGAIALAFGSDWLLTAPGYGKGGKSREYWDFNNKRWTFFANATESHCTLLIDGANQRSDKEARGTIDQFFSTPRQSWIGIDLTEAYANVTAIRREILHKRGDYILIFDSVALKAPASVEWLAQLPTNPELQDKAIIVGSSTGQLRVEMLSPTQTFVPREPTSQTVDVPNIHSYAVKSSGESVNFVALLQPRFHATTNAPYKTTLTEDTPGLQHIVIESPDWSDEIFRANAQASVEAAGVKSTAHVTVIRTNSQGIVSCLAINASSLRLPGIEITPLSPAKIGLQRMPGGSWIVDSDQDIKTQVTTEKKFSLQLLERKIGGNQTSFRYLLARNGETAKEASDWLTSLILFRDKSGKATSAPSSEATVAPAPTAAPVLPSSRVNNPPL